MRRVLRRIIPSMFHRRLTLLGLLSGLLLAALGLKTLALTSGQSHHERRDKAERPLQTASYIPTVRGRILDRTGLVLAVDEPGWDVEVAYRLLSGEWAEEMALAAARVSVGSARWRAMGPTERDAAVDSERPAYALVAEQAWQTLADLARQPMGEVVSVRDAIVTRTERISDHATRRHRQRLLEEGRSELSDEAARISVREQYEAHAVLFDVDERAVGVVGDLIADAESASDTWRTRTSRGWRVTAAPPASAVWLEVAPVRAKHRRYPLETVNLTLDRSSFPGPLRSGEPLAMRVEGVGLHVLGQLRPIYKEDALLKDRPFLRRLDSGQSVVELGGYRAGDRIGDFGVERTMESTLRGSRGKTVRRLDMDTTVSEVLPVAGRDVTLTIDHRLQARAQALMSHDERVGLMRVSPWLESPMPVGTALNGSAVVMDLRSGEVLAAVSVPGISLDRLTNDRSSLVEDFTFEPMLFRPTEYAREPGSTAKPLLLAAAMAEGQYAAGGLIDCTRGYLYESRPTIFQDWIYRVSDGVLTFGEIEGTDAIKMSSNVFFGVLGQRLGAERVAGWLHAFGAGRRLGLSMDERPGNVFDPFGENAQGEANMACIGQGQLTMTPLQVLNAYATLFRGGQVIRPRFVRGPAELGERLPIPESALAVVREGMWKSANEGAAGDVTSGTTYQLNPGEFGEREPYFNVSGVTVYAKSGSAQSSVTREKFDRNGDGLVDELGEVVQEGAHGWVVALVKPDGEAEPTIGVVVCVEHGWSGGKSAAPIANQLLRACQIEGYLPPAGGAGSGGGGGGF